MTDETKPENKTISPFDPALTIKYTKVRLNPEDIERVLTDKLPGYIPFFTPGGANFPGCRLIHFDAFGRIDDGLTKDTLDYYVSRVPNYGNLKPAEGVNNFFAIFANYYQVIPVIPDNHGGIYLYYSSILDEQDSRDIEEISEETRKIMNEKRAARKAAMAAAKEAKDKETADLLALARAVRDAGGAMELIESMRKRVTELEEENKKLSRKIRKSK